MSIEDLIPEEEVVVTITRSGYVKRTKIDNYRAQNRGGKGVRGAALKDEDVVEHFFYHLNPQLAAVLHQLRPRLPDQGYDLQEAGRDSRGQHVANVLAFQPDEHIAQVLTLDTYEDAPYLVLATKSGWSKRPVWPTTTAHAKPD